MREQEFKARDKTVRKMTRDGLVEKNLAKGSEERISSREADVSFRQESRDIPETGERFADAVAPEIWAPRNAPASMRGSGDRPIARSRADRAGGGTKGHGGGQRWKDREDGDALQEPDILQETGTEPRQEPEDGQAYRERNAGNVKNRGEGYAFSHRRSRLRFEKEGKSSGSPDRDAKGQAAGRKQQAEKSAGGSINDAAGKEEEVSLVPERSRLQFEGDNSRGIKDDADSTIHAGQRAKNKQEVRRNRKTVRAEHRVSETESKLEKAQAKLPTRRRVRLEKQYDSASGKVKHRLQFEKATVPDGEKPAVASRAGKALGGAAYMAAVGEADRKLGEAGQDNVAVDAAHKAGTATGHTTERLLRWRRSRRAAGSYRAVRRAEKQAVKAEAGLSFQKYLAENPKTRKKAPAKWIQKQRIRRSYAAAARESAKGVGKAGKVLDASGRAIRALAQAIPAKKTVFGIIAAAVLIMALFSSLFSSCTTMFTGVQSAVLSICYTADSSEIEMCELRYTEMEADLQLNIGNTEAGYPGYDEYRYNTGEIGHNPYELMGYLSAVYGSFTYGQVEAELERLFGLQYSLVREEITEIRTYIDEDGEEQSYEWHVLKTTLTVKPLSEIITGSLGDENEAELYRIFMQTCGNRQCFGNPFDFPWLAYVTSPYGYRIDPATGAKDLHRGIDIGAAAGTGIHAVQDGRVVSAGNAGDYGLCVVVEDDEGRQSVYARCASLYVAAGQTVAQGDVIAAMGNTGSSTGTYLHLEVKYGNEYLNPYYFVANGGSGFTPGGGAADMPVFPEDAGTEMGDGSFAAMLAEAEKYLGYPYVWGGSSPETSFDCSGFVSWVINHSGVGSVGRQTAQGLYNLCTPVSKDNLKPGDLVFFTGTYSSANPVTHVGIYVGGAA